MLILKSASVLKLLVNTVKAEIHSLQNEITGSLSWRILSLLQLSVSKASRVCLPISGGKEAASGAPSTFSSVKTDISCIFQVTEAL